MGFQLRSLCLLCAAIVPLAMVEAQSISKTTGQDSGLQEIVVTASKREESLQSVPAAVSALTGAGLEGLGATDLTGYARTVPGLTFWDMGTGRQQVSIRGLNPSAGAATVSFYIDETPIPADQGGISRVQSNPNLIDIDRVEVLRGPQGTLYGSSSMGGTIKLITAPVDLENVAGYAEVGGTARAGNSLGENANVVGNLPLIDGLLGARAVLWYRSDDGFIERLWGPNKLSDPTQFQGEQKNVGEQTVKGGRLSLLFAPLNALSVTGLLLHEERYADGFGDYTGGPLNPSGALRQVELANVAEPSSESFTLSNLTVKLTVGNLGVTNSSSYYDSKTFITEEGTAFMDSTFGVLFPNRFDEHHTDKDVIEELRFATIEPIYGFGAIGGIYYNNDKNIQFYYWPVPGWNAQIAPAGVNDPSGLYAIDDILSDDYTSGFQRETSEFGEMSFAVNSQLKLTGGARHFHIVNGDDIATQGFFFGNVASTASTPGDFSGTLYKGNVAFQVTPEHLLYAQYSEGFRPGFGILPLGSTCAPNLLALGLSTATNTVAPDGDKNYELGAKTEWLNRRLTVNAAAYRIIWNDIQQQLYLPCGFVLTANAGKAVSNGVEFEAEAQFRDDFSGGFSGSYDRATLSQAEPTFGALAGDQINNVPKYQAAVHAEYHYDLPSSIRIAARADAEYTGSSYADYARLPGTSQRDPGQRLQSLTLLNARLSFARGPWSGALFAQNLLDRLSREGVQQSIIAQVPDRPRYVPNAPRTFGFNFRWSF